MQKFNDTQCEKIKKENNYFGKRLELRSVNIDIIIKLKENF